MGKGRAAVALHAAILGVVVWLGVLAGHGPAVAASYDFTGHWTGTAQQEGQPANALTADFTSTGPKTFTGTVMVDELCTVNGKAKPHMKVVLRVECNNGSIVKIRGRLDRATQTMQGTFAEFRQRRLRHRGTFVLSRQDGSSSTTTTTLPGSQASGHAQILHGPAPSSPAPGVTPFTASVPGDGHWALSPDQGRVTFVNLAFQSADGNVQSVDLTDCVATYVRNSAALTQMLDCPFQLPPGTYVGLGVGVLTTFEVLINDSVNGFYTDPASPNGITTSPPVGGPQFASFVVPGPGGTGTVLSAQTFFTTPIVVDAGAPVTVDIVADMIHTVFANVSGGVPSFDTSLPLPAVQLVASLEGAGKVEFYSPTGTALDTLMPGPTDDESGSVRVFYASPGQASYVFSPVPGPSQAWSVSPATSPVNPGNGFRAGGYLGLDSGNVLCWALPSDYTYASYTELCEMSIVTTVGQTTTLRCQQMTTVPPPLSGDTYASGCPAITPDEQRTLTLVAN
ncbi:MAG: hypothetical protein E6J71_03965 [Deltaproteobacteria bacterium]|nr:MAG: hypothetical protein E6J71_03965 [Deltaproteobacteria bacterium]